MSSSEQTLDLTAASLVDHTDEEPALIPFVSGDSSAVFVAGNGKNACVRLKEVEAHLPSPWVERRSMSGLEHDLL